MDNEKYLKMTKKELGREPSLIRLTPENAKNYVGYDFVFNTRGKNVIRRINRVSPTGKTIYIDHPDLKNNLQTGREIYIIKK